MPFLALIFALVWSPLRFLRLQHHSSHGLPLYILIQHPRNHLFAVKHQKRAVFFTQNLLYLVRRFLLLLGRMACFAL